MADSDLAAEIAASVKSGDPLTPEYATLAALLDPDDRTVPVVSVEVDLEAQKLQTFYQVAGLVGGQSLASLIPSGILPGGEITLQSVSFELFTASQSIGSISCIIAFSPDSQPPGLGWTIATIGSTDLTLTLETLTVIWTEPGQPSQFLSASVAGALVIGSGDDSVSLDLSVTFPDVTVLVEETQGELLRLGSFFDHFGLPKLSFLDDLYLAGFKLDADPGGKSFDVSATIETKAPDPATPPQPLTLIPNPSGGSAILAFDRMWFDFSYAPGGLQSTIGGLLVLKGGIALSAVAAYDSGAGTWTFDGAIDVATSWSLLNNNKPPPDAPAVMLENIATLMFGSSVQLPEGIGALGIAALAVDYQYAKAGHSSYSFTGSFTGHWTLGSADVGATLNILLSDSDRHVSADFSVDGFEFTLTYTFGQTPDVAVAIPALGLSGDYKSGVATVNFTEDFPLFELLAWFVASVTGNRFFALPSPWDAIVDEIKIPRGTSLSLDTASHAVSGTYTLSSPIGLFGVSISGLTLSYDPRKKAAGGSGLGIELNGTFPPGMVTKWDPGAEQPPKVPGQGAALLEFKLMAAGQHIGFAKPPDTVAAAIKDLGDALSPSSWKGGLYPGGMVFSQDYGWLIGSHILVLGQVDIQLIFSDPTIYGLELNVLPSGQSPPTTLDAIQNLFAEILYRKVSDTVGEYIGTLILPDSIAHVDLGTVQITLPSITLSIYTNGDFKIEVGFPYNRDFSHSFSVTAGEYSGAGGFYYGKLDGLDPSELPQVTADYGVFDPVTEIGIGFQVGVEKGFTSGPLSASLSITLQGMFQGAFAKFTLYSTGAQDEYYSVEATVALVGQVSGEIDFVIVTASVQITAFIEVDLLLVAHRATLATASVGVSVSVTVSINLGLFSIHIHCSFSTTITEQIRIGEDKPAIWDQPRAKALAAALALADAPLQVTWQPIKDTCPLIVYFLPQLTAGSAYPAPDGTYHWYYVGQLGLNNPAAVADPLKPADPSESYAAFARGVLRWALNALVSQDATTPIAAGDADQRSVTLASIKALRDALGDPGQQAAVQPDAPHLQALFQNAFQITIKKPVSGGDGTSLGVGFFPLLPGMTVTLQAGSGTARPLAPAAPAHRRDLAAAKAGNPAGALPVRPFGHLRPSAVPAPSADPPPPFNQVLLEDYVLLVMRTALQKVIDLKDFFTDDKDAKTIGDILKALDDKTLDAISGMSTRFMLHGTRRPAAGDEPSRLQPLYALTGQQSMLTTADLDAPSLALGLTLTEGMAEDWGVGIDGGGTVLTLSSADPQRAVFAPKDIPAGGPAIDATGIKASIAPLGQKRPEPFYLKTGIDAANVAQTSLWLLPPSLLARLGDPAGGGDDFALYAAGTAADGTKLPGTPVASADYTWILSVDVTLRRIAVPVADGTSAYLANTYEISSVDQAGLLRLERLIADIDSESGAGPVLGLSLAYRSDRKPAAGSPPTEVHQLVIAPFDLVNAFIVQSNFSTSTRPPTPLALAVTAATTAPSAADNASLVYKIWTAGITNSGGYYLFYADRKDVSGLPDALFGAGNAATVSVVIAIDPSKARSGKSGTPAYVTHLQTQGYPVQDATVTLYLASETLQTVDALLAAGHIGVRVCRTPPGPPPANVYGNTLDHLYNLITMTVATIGQDTPALKGLPPSIGPTDDASTKGWIYNQVFPLFDSAALAASTTGGGPPDTLNPYRHIGETVTFNLIWTDLYGNQLDSIPSPTASLAYVDPLVTLAQLPYLTLGYSFAVADGPQISIAFAWSVPTYAVKEDKRKANDLAAYARACYQLATTAQGYAVTASVATTLLPGKAMAVDTAILLGNLAAIYDTLAKLPVGQPAEPPPAPPSLTPIALAIDPSDPGFAAALYFPLTVSLTLARTGPIADPFDPKGPVQNATMTVPMQLAGTGTVKQTLKQFADQFEVVFATQSLKLAVGSAWRTGGPAQSEQVWIVRYGAGGISVTFHSDAATCYAPKPLSNTLLSRAGITVRTLSGGALAPDSEARSVSVADIDLDAEMRRFLAAFDDIFSPQNVVPAALVNGDAVTSLSASKKAVAEQLLPYVTDLATGASYDPDTDYDKPSQTPRTPIGYAADKYRQECLIRLGAFYDMSSVLVVPVTAGFGGRTPDESINLFGLPAVAPRSKGGAADPASDTAEFTLTYGKAALAAAAVPMAIGLYPKNPSHYADFAARLQLPVGAVALEHGIETVAIGPTLYRAGQWLNFIAPPPAIDIGGVRIPIPVRAFPASPHLLGQSYEDVAAEPGVASDDQNALLRAAKSWALAGRYSLPYVAQDTVYLDVLINAGLRSPAKPMLAAADKDLLDTLVEFNALYPQLQQIFVDQKLSSIRSPQDPSKVKLLHDALASLATLAGTVAGCAWKPGARMRPRALAVAGLPVRESRYTITQGGGTPDGTPPSPEDVWTCTVALYADVQHPVGILPQLQVPGYRTVLAPKQPDNGAIAYQFQDDKRNLLQAKDAWLLTERSVNVQPFDLAGATPPLNIIDRQSGLLSLMVERNAHLPQPFRYATPWIAYKETLTPSLDPSPAVVDMAGVGTADGKPVQRSLTDHLKSFFAALLQGSGTGEQSQGSFQATILFQSPATRDASLGALQVSLPIALRLPTPVTYGQSAATDPSAYVSEMADKIAGWLSANGISPEKPPGIWAGSAVTFDIALYSSLSVTGDPILRLRNVRLPCPYIAV